MDRLPGSDVPVRIMSIGGLAVALAVFLGFGGNAAVGQGAAAVDPAIQVLTRGPVHEAFAGVVTFNPEPGVLVAKSPPEIIEEIPPEEMPEGDNVTWIPGYWAWDDERDGFLWVSGIWRALPPDREWVAGYWATSGDRFQWTSGYWRNSAVTETTYLPAPPATVEVGPNIAAPSPDYGWSPGSWLWRDERYAWQPGYWYQGHADWLWVPAHYVWTPGGYVYVEGYWDYPVARRGVLFAPVYFTSRSYESHGYSYSPRVVIDLTVLIEHLFLRPRYHHYYFGDYYSNRYSSGGYYAPYDYQSTHGGYDPVYAHQRWIHREDRGWENTYKSAYQHRYGDEKSRPPRLWSDMENYHRDDDRNPSHAGRIADSFDHYTKRADMPMRYKRMGDDDKRTIDRRGQEFRDFRNQRREIEGKVVREESRKTKGKHEPVRVKTPKSPVMGKHSRDMKEDQMPPKMQRGDKQDEKARGEARKQDDSQQKARQQDTERRSREQSEKARGDDRKRDDSEQKARQQDTERRSREQSEKARGEARKQGDAQQKARQQDTERRSKESTEKALKAIDGEGEKAKKSQELLHRKAR